MSETANRGPRITRRMVVAAGALVAAPAALLGGRVFSWWDKSPSDGYACLHATEAELIDAIAEAYFPPGGTPALSGRDAGIAAYLDALFPLMDEPTPSLLRTLLHALDDSARLTRGAGLRSLSIEERGAVLSGWARNDNHLVRGAIGGLMTFISTAYCGHPEVRDACGWQFPCGYER